MKVYKYLPKIFKKIKLQKNFFSDVKLWNIVLKYISCNADVNLILKIKYSCDQRDCFLVNQNYKLHKELVLMVF